jgi:hypothetical protein
VSLSFNGTALVSSQSCAPSAFRTSARSKDTSLSLVRRRRRCGIRVHQVTTLERPACRSPASWRSLQTRSPRPRPRGRLTPAGDDPILSLAAPLLGDHSNPRRQPASQRGNRHTTDATASPGLPCRDSKRDSSSRPRPRLFSVTAKGAAAPRRYWVNRRPGQAGPV